MARPRAFDEEKVLQAAADLFWSKGFQATTTRDLTEATGLTQSSIYAAYGDKRGIFLRSLGRYLETALERTERLERTQSPGRAIVGFFREIVDRSVDDPHHRGCMLVNTSLDATEDDPALSELVTDETKRMEAFFHRCIVAGAKSGEIRTDCTADKHAQQLLALLLGLRVLARIRPNPELLNGLVEPALKSLGLAWPPDKSGNPRGKLRPG